jgi:hypothetical protein
MMNYLLLISLCIAQLAFAQNNRQKIRGVITDKLSQTSLQVAAVQIINKADRKGTTSDEEGNYTLSDLSPDRYQSLHTVPVNSFSSSYFMLNTGANFVYKIQF